METNIFKHIKIIFTKFKYVIKMTKQHLFIIENNLQKVRQSLITCPVGSTCPTSVFTGIGQPFMSRPAVVIIHSPLCLSFKVHKKTLKTAAKFYWKEKKQMLFPWVLRVSLSLSVPSAVYINHVAGDFLFVHEMKTNEVKIYLYSFMVQQMYWFQDKF